MAIASLDNLVAALPGQMRQIYKTGSISQAAGMWLSLWTMAGIPGAAPNPSSVIAGDVPTSASAGAIPFTNPTAPALTYLGGVTAQGTAAGLFMLYDRLWQNGATAISPTTTSAQTVNSIALTRPDALGGNAEAWLQVYSAMGAATPAITISYTDQDGNAANTGTAVAVVTGAGVARCFPFSLASGDTGVRSIQSITIGTSWVSGQVGLVIRRHLATIPAIATNAGVTYGPLDLGMPQIHDNACLELMWVPNNTANANQTFYLSLLQG